MNIEKYYQKIKSILGLSFQLAKAEFKLRNEGTYLGIFWYLLNPILTFALLYLVFADRLGNDIKNYPLYLLMGVIMFNFFQSTTLDACHAIKDNNIIIKSIHFPVEALVLGTVLKNLFSHFFEIILFFVIVIFLRTPLMGIIYYPFVLLFFVLFIFGFSLVLSSLTVYIFDLDNIWNFVVRMLWLGTPIFYSFGGQERLFYVNLINPMYYFITVSRELVIYNQLPGLWVILGAIFSSVIFLAAGVLIFARLKNKFSELI